MSPKKSNTTSAKRRAKKASQSGAKYTAALRLVSPDEAPKRWKHAICFSWVPSNTEFHFYFEDELRTEYGAEDFEWHSGDVPYVTFLHQEMDWHIGQEEVQSIADAAGHDGGISVDDMKLVIAGGSESFDDIPFWYPVNPDPSSKSFDLDDDSDLVGPVENIIHIDDRLDPQDENPYADYDRLKDNNVMTYHLDERAEESQITGQPWYDDNDEPHYPVDPQSPPIEDPGNPVEYLVKLDHPVTDLDVASQLVQSIQEDDIFDEGLLVEWFRDDELAISTYSTTYEPDAESINDSLREITEGISGDGNDDAVFYHSVTFDPPVTYPDVVHRIESDLSSYPKIEWSADGREMRVFVHDEESVSERPLDGDHLQALAHQYHAELHIPYITQQEAEADL